MKNFLQDVDDVGQSVVRLQRMGAGADVFILVHGIGVSHRYFLPLARVIAERATVYLVDLPGFGGTPKPQHGLLIEDFARLVLAALARDDVGPGVLVGHSMGCQVVVEMARQSPAAADAVVLLGPTTDSRARTALRQGARLLRDIFHESWRSNVVVFTDYLRAGPIWYAKTLPALLGYRIEEKIGALTVPVLVVRGSRDPVAPAQWVEQLAKLCRHGRMVEVAGQPHVVMYDKPEAVAGLCRTVGAR